ncbi:protein of unknown function [Bradyrhizobium vignae]|uniref:Uncharacterized protein n=1 Tax=Bradyrhizobium vignae TaxID=1549949 RepID=A0A2U3Q0W6_9BRAD|nr:protein of unknown function [Bradyrhizobium vignae]
MISFLVSLNLCPRRNTSAEAYSLTFSSL